MKHSMLLPNNWKIPVLIILALFVALLIADIDLPWLSYPQGKASGFEDMSNFNLTDELAYSGIILSSLALAFCRERVEDEFIRNVRLHAWQWSIIINYLLLILAIWTVYGTYFLGILFYNLYTPILIYLLLFYSRLHILPRLGKRSAVI